ncbi:putative OmpL-like beta-barrel porin-2 [Neolewinella xylanilytica]|uniref:Putative OmpL-like beta-barrel porin-2 n=1 Tax=Neolewinella xylanilytica TaxID=1514080 RepID=A0A2S6I4F3_9BACT|nr:outer membrane beta-barrel protein [Neolewinella xylanilytica]PPK86043.1 putative OmpL-like beta-barrel porin-2 [Neolewinella xylanilytica]
MPSISRSVPSNSRNFFPVHTASCLPVLAFLLLCSVAGRAQTAAPDSTAHQLAVSLYVDAYYATYSGAAGDPYVAYTTVGTRDNALGLNVAQLGLHYTHDRLRGNFTCHVGDIAGATWSPAFPQVQEANVGVRLAGDWWFDAGFFRTHVGTESFLPKNNLLSSTAYATYNEPFYQGGVRLSYAPAPEWTLEAWLLNGYNQFVDGNRAKSVGLLVSYAPTDNASLTYTNLLGKEAAAGTDRFRVYQNVYWNQVWGDRFTSILGFDLGTQANSDLVESDKSAVLYTALLTLRYSFDEHWSVTTRGEHFNDESGFISGTIPTRGGGVAGAKLTAVTLGAEYRPSPLAYLRAEGRYTHAADRLLFDTGEASADRRWELLLTFGIDLDRRFAF